MISTVPATSKVSLNPSLSKIYDPRPDRENVSAFLHGQVHPYFVLSLNSSFYNLEPRALSPNRITIPESVNPILADPDQGTALLLLRVGGLRPQSDNTFVPR